MADSLPDELVEAILLKIPLFSLGAARGVCKRWKRVLGSTSFRESYAGPFTVVLRTCSRLVDGCNTIRYVGGTVACYGKGQMLLKNPSFSSNTLLFGNIITNKWDEIPDYVGACNLHLVLAFVMGDSQYRLVYWNSNGKVWTFDRGQWALLRKPEQASFYSFCRCTHPLLVNDTSMFCLDCISMELVEYTVDGSLSSTRLSTLPRLTVSVTGLVVWENMLYIVTFVNQVLQVREVLEDKSAVSLVECNTNKAVCYLHKTKVDKNILHCYVDGVEGDYHEILYDMEKKSLSGNVKVITEEPWTCKSLF